MRLMERGKLRGSKGSMIGDGKKAWGIMPL